MERAYSLVTDLMTRTLNGLFRRAELYEEQPAARRDVPEALRKLEQDLWRIGNLAEDAEAGGRLAEAEVRGLPRPR